MFKLFSKALFFAKATKDLDVSIAITFAPLLANDSAKIPPPHPKSKILFF